jgi:hypothetical protein
MMRPPETVDYAVALDGEITLILDDEEVSLSQNVRPTST